MALSRSEALRRTSSCVRQASAAITNCSFASPWSPSHDHTRLRFASRCNHPRWLLFRRRSRTVLDHELWISVGLYRLRRPHHGPRGTLRTQLHGVRRRRFVERHARGVAALELLARRRVRWLSSAVRGLQRDHLVLRLPHRWGIDASGDLPLELHHDRRRLGRPIVALDNLPLDAARSLL